MGTVLTKKRSDGSIKYQGQIAIKRDGKLHREARTFDRKQAAAAWLEKREKELHQPGAIGRAAAGDPTLADAIDRYILESSKKLGRTKTQVLKSIKGFHIASLPCSKIGSADIVSFAQEKLIGGVQPQTVGNYLAHLGAIFAVARPAWRYELDPQAMKDALLVTRRMGSTSKSKERDRRPTLAELDKLMEHFGRKSAARPSNLPMGVITAFAIFSTRRQEEITRIAWTDLDESRSRVLVRDMKNPGDKVGNHVRCNLPAPALAIIKAAPKLRDEIFPYTTDAISAAFTRACKFLEIEDLHFHDLRHDGISRLFEMGSSIPEVAAVSGHRAWASLQRYTHLDQSGDKYENWHWLPAVCDTSRIVRIIDNGEFPRKRRSDRKAKE